MRSSSILTGFLLLAMSVFAQQAPIPTGPAVGEKVPDFAAVDQNGKTQTLETLTGPNGLLLLFHRSADW